MVERINTPEVQTAVANLRSILEKLGADERQFADSMLEQHTKYNGISERQFYFVKKLFNDASCREQVLNVGNMDLLNRMFDAASQHLKYVGVTINIKDMGEVCITKPENDRDAIVEVLLRRRSGQPYKYYGKVNRNGDWVPYRNWVKPTDEFYEVLKNFAVDPLQTAIRYGKLTSCCCFCNSGLTDDRSLTVGYGPVCAKNYHLPWG